MTEINLLSFLAVFAIQLVGASAHWLKMKRTKRVRGTWLAYLFLDDRDKSAATFIMLIGTSWFAASSGTGDLLNPELLWSYLQNGSLHITSVNAIFGALTVGYTFDSITNRGAK